MHLALYGVYGCGGPRIVMFPQPGALERKLLIA